MKDEGGEEKERKKAMAVFAFVLIPLVEEAGLMNIFSSQSIRLQLVDREDINRSGRLPNSRFVQVSILDLGENRVMKIGECCLLETSADEYIHMYLCTCASLTHMVHFTASFDEEVTPCGVEGDGHVATFKLYVNTVHWKYNRMEEDSYGEGVEEVHEDQESASVLEVWKFLELCMAGTSFIRG